jgi:predicted  nucleic acid-binding Zn ribbon protein
MKVVPNSNLMQYLFEKNIQQLFIMDNLENEIDCPRCHDIMTLCSDFDFFYYKCEECHFPLYTSPNLDC